MNAFFQMCSSIAPALTIFLFLISTYWLIFFKFQTVVYALLPTDDYNIYQFTSMLGGVTACSFVAVSGLILRQCSVDLIIIDWEKSRGKILPTGNINELNGTRPNSTSGGESAPVSVWRTLFMTNEWNELQVIRLIKKRFIFSFCFVLF